ncbi:MAG: PrpF family protein [Roseomonas sp.]|jgi:2-methylaconitate cis-trans-isomerase PrpF|nr:PrpF family protein [Roseomonas sp.]
MDQTFIPAIFMRGGSSKGVFFHARDLPADRAKQDAIFLAVLGSPDPYGRQLDGMGGGISSLSKAVIIGPPTHPDADVDYLFAQVAVDKPVVDWSSNCGNLSSAVGPFAVDEGLVRLADGEALVRIHQVNTKRIIHARFPVRGGKAVTAGDFTMAGVSGSGARIRLDFLAPGGGATGRLLPTGKPCDTLHHEGRAYAVSLIDAANACAFFDARDLGLTGTESPDAIEADPARMALLDALRRKAGVMMGLAAMPEQVGLALPKIAVVASPAAYRALDGAAFAADTHDIAVRMISMERAHRAVPLTGAMCLGVASRITGSVPHQLAGPPARTDETRVANPSGILSVGAEVRQGSAGWHAESAVVYRSARRLMQGAVAMPAALV